MQSVRGGNFSRTRERNRTRFESEEQAGKLRVVRSSQVSEIRADSVIVSLEGKQVEIPNDFVFVLVGGESPEDFLQKTGIQIVEKTIVAQADPQ